MPRLVRKWPLPKRDALGFQGRCSSGRCDKEGAALSVLTYELGNPCHHGVVPMGEALESYEWSAYEEVLGVGARGRRRAAKCAARVVIAFVECHGVGTAGVTVAELPGVSSPAITVAPRRGRDLMPSRGRSVDEVLSWCAPVR